MSYRKWATLLTLRLGRWANSAAMQFRTNRSSLLFFFVFKTFRIKLQLQASEALTETKKTKTKKEALFPLTGDYLELQLRAKPISH